MMDMLEDVGNYNKMGMLEDVTLHHEERQPLLASAIEVLNSPSTPLGQFAGCNRCEGVGRFRGLRPAGFSAATLLVFATLAALSAPQPRLPAAEVTQTLLAFRMPHLLIRNSPGASLAAAISVEAAAARRDDSTSPMPPSGGRLWGAAANPNDALPVDLTLQQYLANLKTPRDAAGVQLATSDAAKSASSPEGARAAASPLLPAARTAAALVAADTPTAAPKAASSATAAVSSATVVLGLVASAAFVLLCVICALALIGYAPPPIFFPLFFVDARALSEVNTIPIFV